MACEHNAGRVAKYLMPNNWPTKALVNGTVASHRKPIEAENINTDAGEMGKNIKAAITKERRK